MKIFKQKCINTLEIMYKKTTGWHGNNYERLLNLCKSDQLTDEQMTTIVNNHQVIH